MRRAALFLLLALPLAIPAATQDPPPARTILAIGAHAGDMELTTGAVLLGQKRRGDRIVLLHLTLGEGGNPKLTPEAYGAQKKREAIEVAEALGAEVMFGPYRDGELPDDEAARLWVADAIRQIKPAFILTHWRESLHKDHATANAIVRDAVLLASLEGVKTSHPPHRGIRGVWYAENWEDREGFEPFVFVDVTGAIPEWREAVSRYEFARGAISGFPYVEYYTALATVRGAEARKGAAVAFEVDPHARRRVLDAIP